MAAYFFSIFSQLLVTLWWGGGFDAGLVVVVVLVLLVRVVLVLVLVLLVRVVRVVRVVVEVEAFDLKSE